MKNYIYKASTVIVIAIISILVITACSQGSEPSGSISSSSSSNSTPQSSQSPQSPQSSQNSSSIADTANTATPEETVRASNDSLTVRFGDDGEGFTMNLYDNETAKAIANHVGTAAWRLPIYNYDNFENWEVMQYYDIPSRYEIPSNPENITVEKAGEVYYSDPNRIVLFYKDAEVSGEYTKIGYFDYTEEFLKAVEENPVLEGWGNKIVQISPAE